MANISELKAEELERLIEQRKQEMSHMLPNQFTFCLGQKIRSKSIIIKERTN